MPEAEFEMSFVVESSKYGEMVVVPSGYIRRGLIKSLSKRLYRCRLTLALSMMRGRS